MSDEHKAALAEGRRQARAIKAYLRAVEGVAAGRTVSPERLRARLARLEEQLAAATDPLQRVALIQRRLDTQAALDNADAAADLAELERGFVEAAAAYSARKGIGYAAWREAGVPAAVLKRAGITRAG
jgi:hypothetical protein